MIEKYVFPNGTVSWARVSSVTYPRIKKWFTTQNCNAKHASSWKDNSVNIRLIPNDFDAEIQANQKCSQSMPKWLSIWLNQLCISFSYFLLHRIFTCIQLRRVHFYRGECTLFVDLWFDISELKSVVHLSWMESYRKCNLLDLFCNIELDCINLRLSIEYYLKCLKGNAGFDVYRHKLTDVAIIL